MESRGAKANRSKGASTSRILEGKLVTARCKNVDDFRNAQEQSSALVELLKTQDAQEPEVHSVLSRAKGYLDLNVEFFSEKYYNTARKRSRTEQEHQTLVDGLRDQISKAAKPSGWHSRFDSP